MMAVADVSCEKSTCEKYTVRKRGSWWAIFTIDENGMFSVQSDYGSYNYHWNSLGDQTFKEFLTTLDDGYLMGKLGGWQDHFDGRRTKEALKKQIISYRKDEDISAVEAKKCMQEIETLDYYDINCFGNTLMNTEFLSKVFCDPSSIPTCMEHDPVLQGFMERIWPEFMRVLKEEHL